jgi:FkbM family methyltransferase
MIRSARKFIGALDGIRALRRSMPLGDAIRVICAPKATEEMSVFLKKVGRRVCLRNGTTDLKCLEKVFVYNEYTVPFELSPRVIVDAGANIGMATLYFAHRYPEARIIAIEPEQGNFEMLRRNCGNLANAVLIQGAIWPTKCSLTIENSAVDSWEFRVSERSSVGGGDEVSAITIPDILDLIGAKRIDLLKVDIEGSELQLFSSSAEEWIDSVQVITIELHDRFCAGCAKAFYSVLAKRKFVQEIRGENIFVHLVSN